MRIVTITLNPAFDVHATCDSFKEGSETIADIISYDCGGKGINVSRTLAINGVKNEAVCIVGDKNGDSFISGLKDNMLDVKPIYVSGSIRENITIHDKLGIETRLSFSGLDVDRKIVKKVKEEIGDVDSNTIVVFSGSNSKGIDNNDVKSLAKDLKKDGAKIVIDSRSFSLDDLIEVGPWLIKPNIYEARHYCNKEKIDVLDAKEFAFGLIKKGIENVIVSMDENGALFVNSTNSLLVNVPKINAISTIGAGDSTIAGFIYAYSLRLNQIDTIKYANAFGTAKCLREGTLPPLMEDIEKTFINIAVKNI